MDWFLNPGGEIGGEETPRGYFLFFVLGVLIGSMVRLGLSLVPTVAVNWLRTRLLPGMATPSGRDDGST